MYLGGELERDALGADPRGDTRGPRTGPCFSARHPMPLAKIKATKENRQISERDDVTFSCRAKWRQCDRMLL
jgi:hypothetical protein